MLAAYHAASYLTRLPRPYQTTFHFQVITFRTLSTMSLQSVLQSLADLSINPTGTASHNATTSPATWREALDTNPASPKSFSLLKTFVYKPKTKSAVPVIAIAREETEINSAALAKKFNFKELRLASSDILTEIFSLGKDARTFVLLAIIGV
jgi:prolyl-tRNA synthetase